MLIKKKKHLKTAPRAMRERKAEVGGEEISAIILPKTRCRIRYTTAEQIGQNIKELKVSASH